MIDSQQTNLTSLGNDVVAMLADLEGRMEGASNFGKVETHGEGNAKYTAFTDKRGVGLQNEASVSIVRNGKMYVSVNSDFVKAKFDYLAQAEPRKAQEIAKAYASAPQKDVIVKSLGIKRMKDGIALTNAAAKEAIGYKVAVDNLTYISPDVIPAIFPNVGSLDKFFKPFNQGGWESSVVFRYMRPNLPSDVSALRVDESSNDKSMQALTSSVSYGRATIGTYGAQSKYNLFAQEQASLANIDLANEQMDGIVAGIDTLIQRAAFLGERGDPNTKGISGLLDLPFLRNTTAFAQPITESDPVETITALVNAISASFANASYSILPDRFVISSLDKIKGGVPISPTFPLTDSAINDIVLEGFRKGIAGVGGSTGDLELLGVHYLDSSVNGQTNSTYAMYKRDLVYNIMPITPTVATVMSADGFNFTRLIYFRYGGLYAIRPEAGILFSVPHP